MTGSRPLLTLGRRLLLVVLLPTVVLVVSVGGMFAVWVSRSADQALFERARGVVSFFAPAAEAGVRLGNYQELSALLQAALLQNDVVAGAVFDGQQQRIVVTGQPYFAEPERIGTPARSEVVRVARGRLGVAAPVVLRPQLIDDANGNGAAPEHVIGVVYLEFDTLAQAREKRRVAWAIVMIAAVVLAVTAFIARRLAHSVVKPIGRVAEAAQRLADGEQPLALPDSPHVPELRALVAGFNAMAAAVGEVRVNLQARVDAATAQLAHQAQIDPLTGLPNRRVFESELERAVNDSRRADDRGVLCMIDLDRFKVINDSCGHAAGDELLRGLTAMLRERIRMADVLCRIGGDEFALILRKCELAEGFRIAESLREAINAYRLVWDGRVFSVGASIGMMRIDGRDSSVGDIMIAADLACYAAKKAGRNRVMVPPAIDMLLRRQEQASFGDELPFAQLVLAGQPVQALQPREGEPCWVEVLLRVASESGTLQSPAILLRSVSDPQRLLALDLWVAEQAIAEKARSGVACRLGLNLAAAAVAGEAGFVMQLAACALRHQIDPTQVTLEFPASLCTQGELPVMRFCDAARTAGFAIVIERPDGASIGMLERLRPDYIKISLARLAERYGVEAGASLAHALCSSAALLGIRTVASEVEERNDDFASLVQQGFHFAQGQGVAPVARLAEMLRMPPT